MIPNIDGRETVDNNEVQLTSEYSHIYSNNIHTKTCVIPTPQRTGAPAWQIIS